MKQGMVLKLRDVMIRATTDFHRMKTKTEYQVWR